jgi:hypothetical protein
MHFLKDQHVMSIVRALTFCAAAFLCLCPGELVTVVKQDLSQSSISNQKRDNSFLRIAQQIKTDKVTTHSYQYLYDKYITPVRHEELKLLEIGLVATWITVPGTPSRCAILTVCVVVIWYKSGLFPSLSERDPLVSSGQQLHLLNDA